MAAGRFPCVSSAAARSHFDRHANKVVSPPVKAASLRSISAHTRKFSSARPMDVWARPLQLNAHATLACISGASLSPKRAMASS